VRAYTSTNATALSKSHLAAGRDSRVEVTLAEGQPRRGEQPVKGHKRQLVDQKPETPAHPGEGPTAGAAAQGRTTCTTRRARQPPDSRSAQRRTVPTHPSDPDPLLSFAWVAFGLAVLATVGLVIVALRGLRAGPAIEDAMREGLGAGWRASLDVGLAAGLRRHLPLVSIYVALAEQPQPPRPVRVVDRHLDSISLVERELGGCRATLAWAHA
jgi:hypothetical protein